jgi:hypothetical protein
MPNKKYDIGDKVVSCCKACNYIKRDHSILFLSNKLSKMITNIKKLEVQNG